MCYLPFYVYFRRNKNTRNIKLLYWNKGKKVLYISNQSGIIGRKRFNFDKNKQFFMNFRLDLVVEKARFLNNKKIFIF